MAKARNAAPTLVLPVNITGRAVGISRSGETRKPPGSEQGPWRLLFERLDKLESIIGNVVRRIVLDKSLPMALQDPFTFAEIAERWHVSEDFVSDLFREEYEVFRVPRPETSSKRSYTTTRISLETVNRVYQKHLTRILAKSSGRRR